MEYALTDPAMAKIVEKLLQFNPYLRTSAHDLLKLPLFDKIRDPELEKPANHKINLEIDNDGAFNYDDQSSLYYSFDLKEMLIQEVQLLRTRTSEVVPFDF